MRLYFISLCFFFVFNCWLLRGVRRSGNSICVNSTSPFECSRGQFSTTSFRTTWPAGCGWRWVIINPDEIFLFLFLFKCMHVGISFDDLTFRVPCLRWPISNDGWTRSTNKLCTEGKRYGLRSFSGFLLMDSRRRSLSKADFVLLCLFSRIGSRKQSAQRLTKRWWQ